MSKKNYLLPPTTIIRQDSIPSKCKFCKWNLLSMGIRKGYFCLMNEGFNKNCIPNFNVSDGFTIDVRYNKLVLEEMEEFKNILKELIINS